jgi:hypothetical protein
MLIQVVCMHSLEHQISLNLGGRTQEFALEEFVGGLPVQLATITGSESGTHLCQYIMIVSELCCMRTSSTAFARTSLVTGNPHARPLHAARIATALAWHVLCLLIEISRTAPKP